MASLADDCVMLDRLLVEQPSGRWEFAVELWRDGTMEDSAHGQVDGQEAALSHVGHAEERLCASTEPELVIHRKVRRNRSDGTWSWQVLAWHDDALICDRQGRTDSQDSAEHFAAVAASRVGRLEQPAVAISATNGAVVRDVQVGPVAPAVPSWRPGLAELVALVLAFVLLAALVWFGPQIQVGLVGGMP